MLKDVKEHLLFGNRAARVIKIRHNDKLRVIIEVLRNIIEIKRIIEGANRDLSLISIGNIIKNALNRIERLRVDAIINRVR